MKKVKVEASSDSREKIIPTLSPEARENRVIAAAMDLAEKQILEGTASSQVITHFLKLGCQKSKLELEILEKERELVAAKTENLKSGKRLEELYAGAIDAMKGYSIAPTEEVDVDE